MYVGKMVMLQHGNKAEETELVIIKEDISMTKVKKGKKQSKSGERRKTARADGRKT